MWAALVILVITLIISIVMKPKPTVPKPASLSEIEVPIAEIGTPIPVVFGDVLVQSPNVVWYGDLSYSPVKSSGK